MPPQPLQSSCESAPTSGVHQASNPNARGGGSGRRGVESDRLFGEPFFPHTETIPMGIRGFIGQTSGHFELLMPAATAVCVPPALIFLFLQRHMVSGLTAGAVK